MAFNPHFFQGATSQQIRQALNYTSYLITPEQERQLREEKTLEIKVEPDWKQLTVDEVPNVSNQVICPAGPAGVPREDPAPCRITGTNGPNN